MCCTRNIAFLIGFPLKECCPDFRNHVLAILLFLSAGRSRELSAQHLRVLISSILSILSSILCGHTREPLRPSCILFG